MEFLKLFLRGVALLPGLVQGVEAMYGAKTGQQKREAAIALVGSTIGMAEAVGAKTIVDPAKFSEALGVIVDGVVACLNASLWHKG